MEEGERVVRRIFLYSLLAVLSVNACAQEERNPITADVETEGSIEGIRAEIENEIKNNPDVELKVVGHHPEPQIDLETALAQQIEEKRDIQLGIDNPNDFGEVFGIAKSNDCANSLADIYKSKNLANPSGLSTDELNQIWAEMLEEIREQRKHSGDSEVVHDCSIITAQYTTLTCTGVPEQGGAVTCQTTPNAKVKVGRSEDDFYYENASDTGKIIIGFDRDETRALISVENDVVEYNFTPRDYDISRIDGLPPSQVSSFTEEQLKKIRSSSARKKVGFDSRVKQVGLKDGFIHPLKEWNKSSPFGAQRILNGEAKRPHYGVDIAAPVGTPIYAPADGIVSLADDDLYFEGAMVMLDHGQGLNSMYLHVSEIYVEAGQAVKQGDKIAAVGSRGRSTGPHLCWRMKWRNRNLDPELLTKWPGLEHESRDDEPSHE